MKSFRARVLLVLRLVTWMLGLLSPADGRILRWIPNTDFDNARNWQSGQVPCPNQHVRFPVKMPSVIVQRNHTVLELILPNDGELVLGNDVVISFPLAVSNDATCRESEAIFNGSRPMSWFDVENWCEAEDDDIADTCHPVQQPRVDTESIPCATDDVIFPFSSEFVVDLESGVDIKVNMIRIGHQQHTGRTMREYLNSQPGRRQFVRNSTGAATRILVSGRNQCTDPTGCLCGNDEKIQEKVCAIQSARCGNSSCSLQPQGHCCHICGAILTVHHATGFRLKSLENLVKNSRQKQPDSEVAVRWMISKIPSETEDEPIQVVITDDSDGQRAISVAKRVKDALENGKARYGIVAVGLETSETAQPSTAGQTGHLPGRTIGLIVFGFIIIIIIAIVVVVIFTIYRNRRSGRKGLPSVLCWKPADDERSSMELGGRGGVVFDNRIIFEGNTTSFDNLTFGDILRPDPEQLEVQPSGSAASGFSNPTYGSGSIQESFGIPSLAAGPSTAAAANVYEEMDRLRLQAAAAKAPSAAGPGEQPTTSKKKDAGSSLGSRLGGVLKGFRFDARKQNVENVNYVETDDVNGNEKTPSQQPPQPEKDVGAVTGETAAEDERRKPSAASSEARGGSKDEKGGKRRKKKKDGRMTPRRTGERHQKLDDSSDSGAEDFGKKPAKQPEVAEDAGFGNPCYETEGASGVPSTTASPVEEPTEYHSGFSNPLFDEPVRIHGAETGDSQA